MGESKKIRKYLVPIIVVVVIVILVGGSAPWWYKAFFSHEASFSQLEAKFTAIKGEIIASEEDGVVWTSYNCNFVATWQNQGDTNGYKAKIILVDGPWHTYSNGVTRTLGEGVEAQSNRVECTLTLTFPTEKVCPRDIIKVEFSHPQKEKVSTLTYELKEEDITIFD